MKIAILQCDDVPEKLQPEFESYSGMIQTLFKRIDPAYTFQIFDCHQGQYPDDIHRFDFFITTGSRESVYDDKPWIHELIKFVRYLDQQQRKLVGICFGHQLIAKAFDCEVRRSERGWGVGIAQNKVLQFPDWMKQHKAELNLIASHQDQVVQVTEQTQVIAASDFCPYFMLQWNDHLLGIQGHPEFSVEYSRALMLERRNIIEPARINQGLESLQNLQPDSILFARWIVHFVST
jgi:GMP synthase-like glutamine amidotransferase